MPRPLQGHRLPCFRGPPIFLQSPSYSGLDPYGHIHGIYYSRQTVMNPSGSNSYPLTYSNLNLRLCLSSLRLWCTTSVIVWLKPFADPNQQWIFAVLAFCFLCLLFSASFYSRKQMLFIENGLTTWDEPGPHTNFTGLQGVRNCKFLWCTELAPVQNYLGWLCHVLERRRAEGRSHPWDSYEVVQ